MKTRTVLIFIILSVQVYAQQSLEKGFDLLEQGAYIQAKHFFSERLSETPDDLTVQICYGRALGIGEDAQAAQAWFQNLTAAHPGNLEVLLNLYESYLWNKDYGRALPAYRELTRDYPDNFNAWLGYANTLSNLKDYRPAIDAIKRAVSLDPNNQSALTSLKYIRLGYAYQFQLEKDFDAAFAQLDSLAFTHPADTDLLRSRSYTLLAAGETSALKKHLDTLSQAWVPLVRAAAYLQLNKAPDAAQLFKEYLEAHPKNQEAWMGLAHALNAADRKAEAYEQVTDLLEFSPELQPAQELKRQLEEGWAATSTNQVTHHWDNGGNSGWQMNLAVRLPIGSSVLLQPSYTNLYAVGVTGESNQLRTGALSATYRLLPNTYLKAGMSLLQLTGSEATFSYPLWSASLAMKPWTNASLSLGWKEQLEDFNAVLLEQRLRNSRFTLTYHQGSRKGWGIYSNLQEVNYSDGNHAIMVFNSLYKTLDKARTLKAGLNLQYLGFRESRPELYFSPLSYKAAELFGGYEGTLWKSLKVQAGLAGGFQQIETQEVTPVGRVNLDASIPISSFFLLNLTAAHSTISSSNSAGFKFSRVGMGFKWQLSSRPLLSRKTL